MSKSMRRVLPSELVIREATSADQPLLDSFLSDGRIDEMGDSGYSETDKQTREQTLPLIDQGLIKGWIVELPGHGPLSVQLYVPDGIPGVWSGDTVNGPDLGRLQLRWIGTASFAVTLDEFFKDPEVYRLNGHVAVTNPPSLAMCDRLGFTREGIARGYFPHPTNGRIDAVRMSLIRHEWVGAAEIESQVAV